MKPVFLKSMQATRFFAALGVVQYHLWENYFGISIAHPGTDFFLVLVGVIAAYIHAKQIPNGNWWKYIRERYRRLYVAFVPLFIITLLVKLNEATIVWVMKSFFFIPMRDRLPVIGSTWMVSMFLLFYFLFSLCFLARTEKILWTLFLLWIVSILAYNFYNWNPAMPQEWSDLFFSDRNFEFIIGYLVGIVLRRNWLDRIQARVSLWLGLAALAVGTTLLNLGWHPMWRVLVVGIPVGLFILGLATLEIQKADDRIVKVLTTPWLVWVGGTSYVLYLSHVIFFHLWSLFLPVERIWVLPMTIGAILVGTMGYRYWENPILSSVKGMRRSASKTSGVQVATSQAIE